MTARISGTTRLAALIGHPVDHSMSPTLHNAAFAATGVDAVYVALDVAETDVSSVLAGLHAAGALGVNVTIPHKTAALAACVRLDPLAEKLAAVNTLVPEPDGWVGHNTDVTGFLDPLAGLRLERATVLGAGGAARAVVAGLAQRGVETTVVARDLSAANDVASLGVAMGSSARGLSLSDDAVPAAVKACDLVVNATPLGLAGEDLPEAFSSLSESTIAYDLVYRSTPWQRHAEAAGCTVIDGAAMLVGQAAAAFALWTGREDALEPMRAAWPRPAGS